MGSSNGNARPGWGAGGRAGGQHWGSAQARVHSTPDDGLLLKTHKRGRLVTLGKIVIFRGERIFGTPFGNRREIKRYVSLPPRAVHEAMAHGARRWILRFRSTGLGCWIPLEAVLDGRMQGSCGRGELFVALSAFTECAWPDWAYVPDDGEHTIDIDEMGAEPSVPAPRQPSLWDMAS